jgi:hypothetical protein
LWLLTSFPVATAHAALLTNDPPGSLNVIQRPALGVAVAEYADPLNVSSTCRPPDPEVAAAALALRQATRVRYSA